MSQQQTAVGNTVNTINQQSTIANYQSSPVNQKAQQTQWYTQITDQVKGGFTYLQDQYQDYKTKKHQRLMSFPQPKKYPSKPHLIPTEDLKNFNFSKLSQQQLDLLEDLSTFTPHRQFVKMMTNKHSDMKKKQHFIKEHSMILSSDEFGQFNKSKFQYENNSRTFAAFCTGTLTLAGLMIGLWVLPARKSPWKYSFIGLGVGIGMSYGFWRMQIFQYHNRMNEQFKSIMREKYEAEKKTQRLRANQV